MAYDALIVGGGPAGLTAAIYLARFHLSVIVLEDGKSRAQLIPLSRNLPGFPQGISGPDLLKRLRTQAETFGVKFKRDEVLELQRKDGKFVAFIERKKFASTTVILATGVVNRRPDMPYEMHDKALKQGLIRYCPICDGYEITDRPIAVLGSDRHAVREAEFLRSYSKDVALITPASSGLSHTLEHKLEKLGVKTVRGPCKFSLRKDLIKVATPSGIYTYSSIYPALGSDVRSKLAIALGANVSTEGCLKVDSHQSTSIEGLYAAGDVVMGLDQISSAVGHASIAATAIRNRISKLRSMLR